MRTAQAALAVDTWTLTCLVTLDGAAVSRMGWSPVGSAACW